MASDDAPAPGGDFEILRRDAVFRDRGLEVVDLLGEGGSAQVFRARDARNGRDVAIKVLRANPVFDRADDRFLREIRVSAGLRHPHILPLFDSGITADGRLFLVMPVAQGQTLASMLETTRLSVPAAVRFASEIAQALAYLHAQGILHRDVKPQNVFVESGHAVLTDFGLALPLGRTPSSDRRGDDAAEPPRAPDDERFTKAGTVTGTPAYMSPESLSSHRTLDARADVYSLGVTLYEMLTRHLPSRRPGPFRVGEAWTGLAENVRRLRPDVSAALAQIIARATAHDPADRYADCEELASALERLPATEGGSAPPRSVRTAVIAGLVALGFLLAAFAYSRSVGVLDPDRVVVADLANDTGDSSMKAVGVLAGDIISSRLLALRELTVVNATVALPSRLQRRLPPADSSLARQTRSLVQSARAGVAVTGAVLGTAGRIALVATVTDTRTGKVFGMVGPLDADPRHVERPLGMLADSVQLILRQRDSSERADARAR